MALEEKIKELIAVGASVAANNPPEVKYRISRARELGADDGEINEALEIARLVRRGAASKTDVFANSLATTPAPQERGRCRKGAGGGGLGPGNGCGCK